MRYRFILECLIKGKVDQISFVFPTMLTIQLSGAFNCFLKNVIISSLLQLLIETVIFNL